MSKRSGLRTAILRVHPDRTMLTVLGVLTASLLVCAYVILVVPNASYVAIYLNDVMGLTDMAYRTFRGQVPSVDFESLYGAAIHYPAALGFHLGFDAGAVLAFGQFVTAVPLLVFAALTSYRRFPLLHSAILLLFLFLLIVVPMRLGGSADELTYGISYTRYGWAALTIALLFYLEPRTTQRSDLALDSIVLGLLLVHLFYIKITFAAVALAFTAANCLTSPYKMRLSILALSLFLAVFATGLVFTEYNAAYVSDILGVVTRNPAVRKGLFVIWLIIDEHRVVILLCFASLTASHLAGRRSLFDLAFVVGCIASSIMILNQSGGTIRGLPGLVAIFLVFGELARRSELERHEGNSRSPWPGNASSLAISAMLLAFVSEPMVVGALALREYHTELRKAQSADAMNLAGIFVPRDPTPVAHAHEMLGHDDAAHAHVEQMRSGELSASDYLPLIAEGVELLEGVPHDDHAVVSLEHTNPFSVLLRMRPTAYGFPLFWIENLGTMGGPFSDYIPTPERYFSDTDYVMVPETPYSLRNSKVVMENYGPYLEENFRPVGRSLHWRLYAR